MYSKFFKRLIDIIGSSLGILILWPIMLIVSIAIKIDSKGPAIFHIQRVGKSCKPFNFYKFRSMRTDAPKDCAPRLLKSENYITKVGAFIRKTSLDELPQFFCIFWGTMSIIGPRPSGLSEEDLIAEREKYNVNNITPGLTGLAQINGRDELAADIVEKVRFDAEYCENITFIGDVKIFFGTILKVLKSDGIAEGKSVEKVDKTDEQTDNKKVKDIEVAEVKLKKSINTPTNTELKSSKFLEKDFVNVDKDELQGQLDEVAVDDTNDSVGA